MARDDNGWEASAAAWIADMAERGDFAREHVIETPLLARIEAGKFTRTVDIGCGEGRLCRAMQAMGIATVGVEPTPTLRQTAQARDPGGVYVDALAETLPFADNSFDLAVSCLTLIDIDDIDQQSRKWRGCWHRAVRR